MKIKPMKKLIQEIVAHPNFPRCSGYIKYNVDLYSKKYLPNNEEGRKWVQFIHREIVVENKVL